MSTGIRCPSVCESQQNSMHRERNGMLFLELMKFVQTMYSATAWERKLNELKLRN